MSPTLVGRQEELEFLEAFVRAAAVNGGTVLVSGGPGVGKTALLDAAERYARASGTTVLRVVATELEGELSYAALNQALYPLIEEFDELSAAQRDALQVALGFGDGPPRAGCWCPTLPPSCCARRRPDRRSCSLLTTSPGSIGPAPAC